MAKTYKNAICLPCKGCENKALYPNASGGVFDRKHAPIENAFLKRYYRQDAKIINDRWDQSTGQETNLHRLILAGKITDTKKHLKGKYIFAGYLFPHFGHFLLESLANLWYFKKHPETPIIWLGVHNQPDLNEVAKQFIELYNIENPVHILTEQTEIEQLVVPAPGYVIHTHYTDEQVKALQVVSAPNPKQGKKVWLSRSKLKEGALLNEATLEETLSRNGWTIFHPQEHSIINQITMLKDAEEIAGIEGSAFHLLMMFPDYKGKVKIFARRDRIEFDFIAIANTLNIDQQVYYPQAAIWSHGQMHWEYNRFWLRLTPVLDALNIKRANAMPKAPLKPIHSITQSLTRHFKHDYALELWSKDTSISLSAQCKTLTVSTDFQYDTHGLPQNTDHLDITADQLFTTALLKAKPDLICFRHHADEQTLVRAFNGSFSVAQKSTLWLIEYYADERELNTENTINKQDREQSANAALIKYISSCHPNLTIARVRGCNAAVIWQQPRHMTNYTLPDFKQLDSFSTFDHSPIYSLTETANVYKKWLDEN